MDKLQSDWEQIIKCFSALKSAEKTRPSTATTRQELVQYAANIMKPRSDNKRLVSQINFVCFGIAD